MINNIEYNSQKELLTISEYGRNVQNLVTHAKAIEDDEERQHFAEAIINLMHQMNPMHRNNQEYREKLWRHFFRIADFDIKVVPPDGEIPNPESSKLSPDVVPYPNRDYNYRHYGNNVKSMITKAIAMEDEEKRIEFAETIGAYMKLAYRTWSREHYVSDEIIREDIKKLSKGVLVLDEEKPLDSLTSKIRKRPARPTHHSNNSRNRRHNKSNNRRRR
ncbi:MAG: DUF4290 domain-containing protein [Saprospiraceae bacterium]|nr:DUF4290 domain-containing protein [Saprospiraceae bacterium]|tara:strand:+ start:833 stop:1486 length:654 start_codon:yes stop_codon:yes gene_type:complete